MISTSLQGVAGIAARSHPLAADPGFRFALGTRPERLTSLVYLDVSRLLTLGEQTGLARSATYRRLRPDLEKITSIGLTSTRDAGSSTSNLAIRIPSAAPPAFSDFSGRAGVAPFFFSRAGPCSARSIVRTIAPGGARRRGNAKSNSASPAVSKVHGPDVQDPLHAVTASR